MKRILSGIFILALVAGAAPSAQDKGKTPELTKKFVAFMEANSKEVKGIKEDIDKDRPESEIKKRLTRIRENLAKANALKYRKDEEDAERLEGHFDIFAFKLKSQFEDVEWGDKEARIALLDRLKDKCDVCHMDRLRD